MNCWRKGRDLPLRFARELIQSQEAEWKHIAAELLDGLSQLLLVIKNNARPGLREPLYFQDMDNRAIRAAGWRMAKVEGTGRELFRTSVDPLENENLAAQNPAIVTDLDARWRQWWREQNGPSDYQHGSTKGSRDSKPQGHRGSGARYRPGARTQKLSERHPLP